VLLTLLIGEEALGEGMLQPVAFVVLILFTFELSDSERSSSTGVATA